MAGRGADGVGSSERDVLLDLDLNQLDEKEFDLPAVDVPSLETILQEVDSELDIALPDGDGISDVFSPAGYFAGSLLDSTDDSEKRKKKFVYEGHGPVVKHLVLSKIAAQLSSAQDRVNAGTPTAICVDIQLAVGTSRGLVLTFDTKQILRRCLGSAAIGEQHGAVSALGFSRDGTRLLVGFARGAIMMWDLTDGSLLRTLTDAHPPGSAVLHVKFTDSHTLAVCSDSSGSVYELEFTRIMGIRGCNSRCLFTGSRGEVCCVEPLRLHPLVQDRTLELIALVAMATWTKVWLVALRPELNVVAVQPLSGGADCLPLLAWQFVYIEMAPKHNVFSPVLTCARESSINFYQVVCKGPKEVYLEPIRQRKVPFKIVNFMWVDTQIVGLLDTSERVHILDVRSWEELECLELSHISLVYGTSFYKSLATGGNVSPALAFAADRACYQSVCSYRRQLFFLGTKYLTVMHIRLWNERIDVLLGEKKYKDALALAYSFYNGTAKAVLGLRGSRPEQQEVVSSKMMDILYDYVDASMTRLCPVSGKIEELVKYYKGVVPICVDCCLLLDRLDVLFGKLYERFGEDVIARGTFLECLEPYILEGRLTTMSPIIIKDLAAHFHDRGMLNRVEACIVHLNIISLDIHETVKLCWDNSMYDAFIYVYNEGLHDYITPLQKLLGVLRESLKTGKQLSDDQLKIGHKLLVYISCCLGGAAYPPSSRRVPEGLGDKVKQEVFKCITCLHSNNASPDEQTYPNLRILLQFDTKEFLNVLALAFEEPDFNTPDGALQKQRVVDILLHVMVESSAFAPYKIGCLFTFLARQMARHGSSVKVNRLLCDQILEYLCHPGDSQSKDERQEAILELLSSGSGSSSGDGGLAIAATSFDAAQLLAMAERGELYRVCEHLYKQQCLYDKMLRCYLNDKSRRHQAFSFIENSLVATDVANEMKDKVREVALDALELLVTCDGEKTARLLVKVFRADVCAAAKRLAQLPSIQYQFLAGVVTYCENVAAKKADGTASSSVMSVASVGLSPNVIELYLEKMCLIEPRRVDNFLKSSSYYRLPEALDICKKYQLLDAVAYLLEKSGDVKGAFRIVLQRFNEDLQKHISRCRSQQVNLGGLDTQDYVMLTRSQLQMALIRAVELCQRHSSKMGEQERVDLWFPLLDAVMAPLGSSSSHQATESGNEPLSEIFKDLSKHVLNSMLGYIPLPALMNKIDSLFSLGTGKFGDIKDVLLGLLSTYDYEKTLMSTCNTMLNRDLVNQRSLLRSTACRGIAPKALACAQCLVSVNAAEALSRKNARISLFSCGHLYHRACLERCSIARPDEDEGGPADSSSGGCSVSDGLTCPICNPHSRSFEASSRRRHLPSSSSDSAAAVATDAGVNRTSRDPDTISTKSALATAARLRTVTTNRSGPGDVDVERFAFRVLPGNLFNHPQLESV